MGAASCLTVLLVEDNPDDARLVQKLLADDGANGRFAVEWADRLQAGRERLSQGGIDVVLTDLKLPDSVGLDTFRNLHTHVPGVPIVLLTGTYTEDQLAIQALREGAQDYLVKGGLTDSCLPRTLRYAVERKRTEEALRVVMEELRHLNGLKDEFLSTVSHELRTPLAITREGISLVLDGVPGEINKKQHKILMTAQQNIDRLARLINDLLDTSKLEAGKTTLHRERVNLQELITRITSTFKPKAHKKGLMLTVDVPQEDLEVYADVDKITQVLTNLVGNALKFTEHGSITVSAREQGDEVVCQITDTGKGISKEDRPIVFSKFQQFDRTPGAGEKGTGLGLAITKGLIELHDGTIQVASELGTGTTFTFTLPRHTLATHLRESVSEAIQAAAKHAEPVSLLVIPFSDLMLLEQRSPERGQARRAEMAALLQNTLHRERDQVIQAPSGIALLLVGCDGVGAASVKGRVETVLMKYFTERQMSPCGPLAISCVTYPDDASSAAALIEQAQNAARRTRVSAAWRKTPSEAAANGEHLPDPSRKRTPGVTRDQSSS